MDRREKVCPLFRKISPAEHEKYFTLSAGAVEYADCTSAEG